MPTPSGPDPDPQSPYAFSNTCPDTDDASRTQQQQHEAHLSHGDDDGMPPIGTGRDDGSPTQPIDTSHFASSDRPDRFAQVDSSSPPPADDGPGYHKSTDDETLDQAPSPYGLSPVEPPPTVRPRQGVGTRCFSGAVVGRNATYKSQDPCMDNYAMKGDYNLPRMGSAFPSKRVTLSSPSPFLRSGSRFTGTQQSERQVYQVQVEIKYVDLQESFLCGYLRIQGLTEDHPSLTTYFEGEIINGTKYGFLTKRADWGANDKTDLSHWAKFPAFRPYSKQARRNGGGASASASATASALHDATIGKDVAQSEHIFMRWKELFLVPDHRVRTITGASFEGFYYICFNQVLGEVSGIYFHSKSERFQQLELKHVEDRGCFNALEFR